MKYISWFAGIGGFDIGFDRAGMECVGQCEIDKYCNIVLESHYPEVERIDDIRKVSFRTGKGWRRYKRFSYTDADVFCAGSPCQDVSVAGKRKGLAGSRSGLWYEFHRIVTEYWPSWIVFENVPGLLSSNKGRDFAFIIGGLTGIIPEVPSEGWGNAGFARGPVYSLAWRILDAQYFGVAQRRRRLFIVANIRNKSYPAKVLFEPESGTRDTPPSRETGKEVTGCLTARAGKDGAGANGQIDKLTTGVYQWASGGGDEIKDTAQSLRAQAEHNYQVLVTPVPDPAYAVQGVGSKFGSGRDGQDTFVTYNIQTNDRGKHRRKDRPDGGLYINKTEKSLTVGSSDKTVVAYDVRNMKEDGEVTQTLQAKDSGGQSLNFQPVIVEQNNVASTPDKISLRSNPAQPVIAFQQNIRSEVRLFNGDGEIAGSVQAQPGMQQQTFIAWQNKQSDGDIRIQKDGTMPTLTKVMGTGGNNVPFVGVRRLTPKECERLQGFPDSWTDVNGMSDTQRYKQLGNAVCVNVAEWIGKRIMMVERGEI